MRRIGRRIILIIISIVFVVGIVVLYFIPKVPVRKCDREPIWNGEAYELAYNVYGQLIFKNSDRALKQFKKDYAECLTYLNEVCGYPEFSTKYETMQRYAIYGWQQSIEGNPDNPELLRTQMNEVSKFAYAYWPSSWQYYFPFFKHLS